jgi:hypothetical protein
LAYSSIWLQRPGFWVFQKALRDLPIRLEQSSVRYATSVRDKPLVVSLQYEWICMNGFAWRRSTFVTKIRMQTYWLFDDYWNPITLVLIWKALRQAFRWYHYFWASSITFWNFLKIPSGYPQLMCLLAILDGCTCWLSSHGCKPVYIGPVLSVSLVVVSFGCLQPSPPCAVFYWLCLFSVLNSCLRRLLWIFLLDVLYG